MNHLFDDLYQTGIGFKNERELERKIARDTFISREFRKALKLKTPRNIKEHKSKTRKGF